MMKRGRRPFSSKQKILLVGVLAGFSIFYFGYYLPFALSQLPPDNLLVKYPFPDNKWFDADDVTITDTAEFFQLPVTGDRLSFSIEYRNKGVGNLTISPELTIIHGGRTTQKIASDPIAIAPNESYEHEINFYLNNTGLSHVTLYARILNSTDSTILDTVSGTYNIRLFSQSDAFPSQLNEITNLGIFISVGVAVFSIFFSVSTSRLSKRQVEAELDEQQKTLRPWIGAVGLFLDEKNDYCRLHYHNYGRLPASSAKYKFKVGTNPISSADLRSSEYIDLVSNNIIFPDFDHTLLISVDKTIGDEARKGSGKLFVGVLIEYQYGYEKRGRYEGIFEYKSKHSQFAVIGQEIDLV